MDGPFLFVLTTREDSPPGRRRPWFSDFDFLLVTTQDKLSTDPFDQFPAILFEQYVFATSEMAQVAGAFRARDLELAEM